MFDGIMHPLRVLFCIELLNKILAEGLHDQSNRESSRRGSSDCRETFSEKAWSFADRHGRFLTKSSALPWNYPGGQRVGSLGNQQSGQGSFEAMCRELENHNAEFGEAATVEEAIAKVAKVVGDQHDLLQQMMELSTSLSEDTSEFAMTTDEESYQELVESIVEATRVLIAARADSTNVIERSEIRSESTHLHASGGSRNFVDKTHFKGSKGSVGMDGISAEGDIHVSDSSIGLGNGGKIIFGGNPNQMSGTCPKCGGTITADKRKLVGYTHIQCPTCFENLKLPSG